MNIALIALSGIRVWDQDLLALGMTMPGFVERGKTIASLPSLGLLTLAGATPPGHRVSYHEVRDLADFDLQTTGWDLAAISSLSAQIHEAYALADRLRQQGVRVVMGGLHVTSLPEEAAAHADAVVIGEAEAVWPRLVADAEAGRLQRVYDGRVAEFDLAASPLPAFSLLDPARYNRLTVQTNRGCPHACEFCASSILLTRRYKQKPVGRVLAEIDAIRRIWPRPFIEFADDNSLLNKAWWRELLPELRKRRIRWFAESDISVGRDPDFLRELRTGGCCEILIGLESPIPAGLPGIELRADWKRQRQPDYASALRNIQSAGIPVNGCFVLGLDGHGPGIFDAVYDFSLEHGLYDVQITYPTPFPGTPFYQRLRAAGRLLEEGAWHKCTLFDILIQPTHLSVEELRAGFYDLTRRLYSDETTRARRQRFREIRRSRKG